MKIKLGMIAGPFFILIIAVSLAWASGDDLYSLIRLFDRIAVTVSDKYVDKLDNEKLIYAGIEGMLDKLDPYSSYLEHNDYFYLIQETQGEYAGTGIELEKTGDSIWVCSVIKNSPAAKANIKIGDRIIKIDTISVVDKSIPDCRKLLRGEENSQVELTLYRPLLGKELELELTREEIYIDPVPYWFVDQYNNGYIKISRFSEGSIFAIKSVISILLDKKINGLIVDLRDNPGGLLYESIEVAALFLDKGERIVETKSRGGASMRTYNVREDGIYNSGALTVLINGQTASAAEIVAGAIQDNDRGLIIGSTSFGKGLVQQILKFSDHSALKLTTAKYYTPSDRCIQKDRHNNELLIPGDDASKTLYFTEAGRPVFGGGGIIPDIYVELFEYVPLIDEVITSGYIDKFTSDYCNSNIIDRDFKVDDKLVDHFINYLNKKDYIYQNDSFIKFEEFKSGLDGLPCESRLNEPLAEINNILNENAANDLLSVKSALKNLLYEYLITYKFGDKVALELAGQFTDPELSKAGEVLRNPDTYSSLLVGY